MTKTLVRTPKLRFGFQPLQRRARLAAGFFLLALVAAISLAASRPAHTAGGPIAVTVANAPLPTVPTDVSAPTQPFQYTFQPSSDAMSRISESITVPLHKRLVIEYISASLNQYSPGIGGFVDLQTTAGGDTVYYYLTDSITDFSKRNQQVRIYADPGTTVTVEAVSSNFSTPGIGSDTEISGYYVDVP